MRVTCVQPPLALVSAVCIATAGTVAISEHPPTIPRIDYAISAPIRNIPVDLTAGSAGDIAGALLITAATVATLTATAALTVVAFDALVAGTAATGVAAGFLLAIDVATEIAAGLGPTGLAVSAGGVTEAGAVLGTIATVLSGAASIDINALAGLLNNTLLVGLVFSGGLERSLLPLGFGAASAISGFFGALLQLFESSPGTGPGGTCSDPPCAAAVKATATVSATQKVTTVPKTTTKTITLTTNTPLVTTAVTPKVTAPITPQVTAAVTPTVTPTVTLAVIPAVTPAVTTTVTPEVTPAVKPTHTLQNVIGASVKTLHTNTGTTQLVSTGHHGK